MVRRGIDQRAVVMLAVDFDEGGTDRADLHADRLVVDESAGPAVGDLDAAQDQLAVGRDLLFAARCAAGWHSSRSNTADDLALRLRRPHQRAFAAGAERQRERIEQDRLARAGFAGQHGQPGPKSRSSRSIKTMSRIDR